MFAVKTAIGTKSRRDKVLSINLLKAAWFDLSDGEVAAIVRDVTVQ